MPELKRLVENNFELALERTKHKLFLHFLQFWQIFLAFARKLSLWRHPVTDFKDMQCTERALVPLKPESQCKSTMSVQIDRQKPDAKKYEPFSPLYESREKLRHAETEIYFTCGVRRIILAICHDDGWAFSTIWLFLIFVNTDPRNDRIWGNGPPRLIFYNALILELKRLNYTGVSN